MEEFAPFRAAPDRQALRFDGATFTFAQLDERSAMLAAFLLGRGFTPGDRLAVWLPNSPAMIELLLACWRIGVIFVPMNILYREREIEHILADAAPRDVISAQPLPGGGGSLLIADVVREAADCTLRKDVSFAPRHPAAIVYTSGTTGRSKGAILSRRSLLDNGQTLVREWKFTERDRLAVPLPLSHVHALGNGLFCWLLSGCTLLLTERFEAARASEWLIEERASVLFAVPTIYVRLLEASETRARQAGHAARLFVSGSAPLPAEVLEGIEAKFGQRILERYGMTETLMIASNPIDGERRAGTVGPPLPGVSVRIVDSEGSEVEEGELLVRSPAIFSGYWRQPEASAKAFEGEWFRTGDIASRSVDGYLSLRGRRSDLIISGGFNVYPREIEELLLEHPAVAEAAVTSQADAVRGEVPVAYLVVRQEVTPAELESYCRTRLASFKVPRSFTFVPSLPRTALGKIQKHLLGKAE